MLTIVFTQIITQYGSKSEDALGIFKAKQKQLLLRANSLLAKAVDEEDVNLPFQIFSKIAEFHVPTSPFFLPKTKVKLLNKIACCLRRFGRIQDGIKELEAAEKLCKLYDLNAGETYSNLGVMYSEKGLHKKSLKIAEQSVIHLFDAAKDNKTRQTSKLLGIAFYNCGREQLYLEDYLSAKASFKKAVDILKQGGFSKDEQILKKTIEMEKLAKYKYASAFQVKHKQNRSAFSRKSIDIHHKLANPSKVITSNKSSLKKLPKKHHPYGEIKELLPSGEVRESMKRPYSIDEFRTKLVYKTDEFSTGPDTQNGDKINFYKPLNSRNHHKPYIAKEDCPFEAKPTHNRSGAQNSEQVIDEQERDLLDNSSWDENINSDEEDVRNVEESRQFQKTALRLKNDLMEIDHKNKFYNNFINTPSELGNSSQLNKNNSLNLDKSEFGGFSNNGYVARDRMPTRGGARPGRNKLEPEKASPLTEIEEDEGHLEHIERESETVENKPEPVQLVEDSNAVPKDIVRMIYSQAYDNGFKSAPKIIETTFKESKKSREFPCTAFVFISDSIPALLFIKAYSSPYLFTLPSITLPLQTELTGSTLPSLYEIVGESLVPSYQTHNQVSSPPRASTPGDPDESDDFKPLFVSEQKARKEDEEDEEDEREEEEEDGDEDPLICGNSQIEEVEEEEEVAEETRNHSIREENEDDTRYHSIQDETKNDCSEEQSKNTPEKYDDNLNNSLLEQNQKQLQIAEEERLKLLETTTKQSELIEQLASRLQRLEEEKKLADLLFAHSKDDDEIKRIQRMERKRKTRKNVEEKKLEFEGQYLNVMKDREHSEIVTGTDNQPYLITIDRVPEDEAGDLIVKSMGLSKDSIKKVMSKKVNSKDINMLYGGYKAAVKDLKVSHDTRMLNFIKKEIIDDYNIPEYLDKILSIQNFNTQVKPQRKQFISDYKTTRTNVVYTTIRDYSDGRYLFNVSKGDNEGEAIISCFGITKGTIVKGMGCLCIVDNFEPETLNKQIDLLTINQKDKRLELLLDFFGRAENLKKVEKIQGYRKNVTSKNRDFKAYYKIKKDNLIFSKSTKDKRYLFTFYKISDRGDMKIEAIAMKRDAVQLPTPIELSEFEQDKYGYKGYSSIFNDLEIDEVTGQIYLKKAEAMKESPKASSSEHEDVNNLSLGEDAQKISNMLFGDGNEVNELQFEEMSNHSSNMGSANIEFSSTSKEDESAGNLKILS